MLRELLAKPISWILAVALLLIIAQNAGIIGRASDVLGGEPTHGGLDPDVKRKLEEHVEQTRKAVESLQRLEEGQRQGNQTQATGLRILCLQNAKTTSERNDCARIQ